MQNLTIAFDASTLQLHPYTQPSCHSKTIKKLSNDLSISSIYLFQHIDASIQASNYLFKSILPKFSGRQTFEIEIHLDISNSTTRERFQSAIKAKKLVWIPRNRIIVARIYMVEILRSSSRGEERDLSTRSTHANSMVTTCKSLFLRPLSFFVPSSRFGLERVNVAWPCKSEGKSALIFRSLLSLWSTRLDETYLISSRILCGLRELWFLFPFNKPI